MRLSILKVSWEYFGLEAPWFAWVGAVVILLMVGFFYWRLNLSSRREIRLKKQFSKALEKFRSEHPLRWDEGLAGELFEELGKIFSADKRYGEAWARYRSLRVRLTVRQANSQNLDDNFWASESAANAFGEETLTAPIINKSFYQSIPGVFTGIGLLLTFIAILVALIDVRMEGTRVAGLDLLIKGLSGKFLTSIAALFAASMYMLLEKPIFNSLAISHRQLVEAIDTTVPRLNTPQVLANIHHSLSEQTDAFRLFNADLSTRLTQSVSAGLGPTLERMLESIEELNRLLRAAESGKQEAMGEQIRVLLQSVEKSMSETLTRMGASFSESLSGGARNEFKTMVDSLAQSARFIKDLNTQFENTQSAITALVEMAQKSTSDQVALGRRHSEEIATTLHELMRQLKETTGLSSDRMLAALAGATDDLSKKASDLADRMSGLVQESTGKTHDTAVRVIDSAEQFTVRSAERLEVLLTRLGERVDQTGALKGMLESSMAGLGDVLGQYRSISEEVRRVTGDLGSAASSVKDAVTLVHEIQAALQLTATHSVRQLEKLGDAHSSQEELWTSIDRSMEHYRTVFSQVEGHTQGLLGNLATHLSNFSETTSQHFDKLVSVANDHVSDAVNKLRGAINELESSVQELSESLSRFQPPPGRR